MTEQRQNDRIAERLENMTLIQERMLGRLEVLEKWKDSEERARERAEDRREERTEKAPDQQRANAALVLSAIMALIYVLQIVSQHWK